MSIGFLSQTFLAAIKSTHVLVPVVTWDLNFGMNFVVFNFLFFPFHCLVCFVCLFCFFFVFFFALLVVVFLLLCLFFFLFVFCLFFCFSFVFILIFFSYSTFSEVPVSSQLCAKQSLLSIKKYSPFDTKAKIIKEFEKVPKPTGTRIVIFNLRKQMEGLCFC